MDATRVARDRIADSRYRLFQPAATRPRYAHPASSAIDYAIQPLLPDQVSRQGPPVAVAE